MTLPLKYKWSCLPSPSSIGSMQRECVGVRRHPTFYGCRRTALAVIKSEKPLRTAVLRTLLGSLLRTSVEFCRQMVKCARGHMRHPMNLLVSILARGREEVMAIAYTDKPLRKAAQSGASTVLVDLEHPPLEPLDCMRYEIIQSSSKQPGNPTLDDSNGS